LVGRHTIPFARLSSLVEKENFINPIFTVPAISVKMEIPWIPPNNRISNRLGRTISRQVSMTFWG
jgi:hypothetical protein